MKDGADKPAIGWREWVGLPELSISKVKAKVDTGARSSSLHAFDVQLFHRGSKRFVRFKVHPIQHDSSKTTACEAPLHDQRWVRSSNGKREFRPVIRTLLNFAGQTWPIDLTLTSRDLMGFRMLLGREAVRSRFVVDAGRSFLFKKKKRKKVKASKHGADKHGLDKQGPDRYSATEQRASIRHGANRHVATKQGSED